MGLRNISVGSGKMGEFETNSNKRANASHYVRRLRYYVEIFEGANLKTTGSWLPELPHMAG